MLKLIGKAEVELIVNASEKLGVDKVLFLFKSLFVGTGCTIAQAPEIIGIVAVGSLETGDMIFFRKEDGRAEHEDQLFFQRIQAQ